MSHSPPVSTESGRHTRVDGDAFVQMEQPSPVGALDDARCTGRTRSPRGSGPSSALIAPGRDDEQRREQRRRRRGSARRAGSRTRPRGAPRSTRNVRWVPIAGIRTSAGRNVPSSEPGRGQRVQPARDGAGGRDRRDREPDRERRDHPEQDDRRGAQEEDGEEAPDDGARGRRVEPVDREVEERLRGERDRRRRTRAAASTIKPRSRGSGRRSATPPAEPVAERERAEDDPDEVRPDDRGRAEVRREQPRRGDLGRERADTGAEDQRSEREAPGPVPGGGGGHLEAEDALDLAEGSSREHRCDHEDEHEHEPEANARPALRTMPTAFAARRARWCRYDALDRVGIERRLVVGRAAVVDRRCRLRHEGILGTCRARVQPPSRRARGHMLPAMEGPRGRGRMSFPGAGELSSMGGRLTFSSACCSRCPR